MNKTTYAFLTLIFVSIFLHSFIQAQSSLDDVPLMSEKEADVAFRVLTECVKIGPCTKKLSEADVDWWLTNTSQRVADRHGLPDLDYKDFARLKKRYGNAIAKYMETKVPPYNAIVSTFIVNGEEDSDDYSAILAADCSQVTTFMSFENSLPLASICPPSVSTKVLAKKLMRLMDKDGNGVDTNEFITYILKYQ